MREKRGDKEGKRKSCLADPTDKSFSQLLWCHCNGTQGMRIIEERERRDARQMQR